MTDTPSSISRRTIAKGIAWTAPVLTVAAAAPALAASVVDPPPATYTQISVDQGYSAGEVGLIKVTGRTGGPRPEDGALPPGTAFTLTPSEGAIISIDSADQVGIAAISGPDASGSYTVTPVEGVVIASLYATLDVPGTITVQMIGIPGGPSSGVWV